MANMKRKKLTFLPLLGDWSDDRQNIGFVLEWFNGAENEHIHSMSWAFTVNAVMYYAITKRAKSSTIQSRKLTWYEWSITYPMVRNIGWMIRRWTSVILIIVKSEIQVWTLRSRYCIGNIHDNSFIWEIPFRIREYKPFTIDWRLVWAFTCVAMIASKLWLTTPTNSN